MSADPKVQKKIPCAPVMSSDEEDGSRMRFNADKDYEGLTEIDGEFYART